MKQIFFITLIMSFFFFSCGKNKINVQVGKNLNIKDVKITLKADDGGSPITNFTIFEDGISKRVPNVYGENDWKVYYNDSLIIKFRHFKTNARNTHDYNFGLNLENNGLRILVDIKGDNDMVIEN